MAACKILVFFYLCNGFPILRQRVAALKIKHSLFFRTANCRNR